MRFFAPQGQHVAPMGVKFGMEEGTFGHRLLSLRAGGKLFHATGPQKAKLLYQGVYRSNQTNFQNISRRFPGDILTKL